MKQKEYKTMFGSQKVWWKIQGKENIEEKYKKIKNKFKTHKLFWYITLNFFYLFKSSI